MLYFVILDDDATHNINTKKRLEVIFKKYDLEAKIALNTTNPDEVIQYCLRNSNRKNVYLLDVNVESRVTGIDVAGIIREQDAMSYIVFISAYPEFVMASLKTKVFDYLIKPVSLDTLESCVNSIYKDYSMINAQPGLTISIKSGFNVYNIDPNEIAYLEKYGHILVVHTVLGMVETMESLESMEHKLDQKTFFRCHKSYLVNVSYITRIDYPNSIIYLKTGDTCMVSKRCKKELKSFCSII